MRIFTQEIIVAPQHIDIQNRVSNLCYVQWMQDLAINHSTVQGWGVDRYEAEGHGWVVRQHTITYKRPALAGDVITAATWVAELASRQSLRRYLFWRAADRSVLAEAATVWVYIDMATGRPSRLPASLQSAFEYISPALLSMTERDRPLHVEPRKKTGDHLRFPVGRSQKREADGSPSLCDGGWLHTAAANPWAAAMPQLKSASAQARLLSMP